MIKKRIWLNIFIVLKWLMVAIVVIIAYRQIQLLIDEGKVMNFLSNGLKERWVYLLCAILLVPVNWMLEVYKWKLLSGHIQQRNIIRFLREVFAGVSLSIITPQRLGEYVGRLAFFSPDYQLSSVSAQLHGTLAQLSVTLFGGILGLILLANSNIFFLPEYFSADYLLIAAGIILIVLLALYFKYNRVKHLIILFLDHLKLKSWSQKVALINKTNRLPLVWICCISFVRYSVYCFQFLLLLYFFEANIPWLLGLSVIALIYLIQSGVPLPSFFSLMIRSEIAILLLGNFIETPTSILSASYSLWIINLGIPALIGIWPLLTINIKKALKYDQ